jgi:hypothetical protein
MGNHKNLIVIYALAATAMIFASVPAQAIQERQQIVRNGKASIQVTVRGRGAPGGYSYGCKFMRRSRSWKRGSERSGSKAGLSRISPIKECSW